MKLHRLAVATFLATAALAAHAEFTVSPMVGQRFYDNDAYDAGANFRDRAESSLAAGYRVNPNVGLELRYGLSNTVSDRINTSIRHEMATLDTYYRFNVAGNLQPYVLVGGGLSRATPRNGLDHVENTVANAAIGAFYKLSDSIGLRVEVRGVENLQASTHDAIASVGLTTGFGGAKAAAPAPAKLAPVAAPVAPVVVAPADDDKDGVVNSADQCPGTPINVVVDATGCPKMLTEKVTKELRVQFDTNKAIVKPAYNAEIEGVAKLLKEYPTAKVEIQGHTDSRGAAKRNDKLSQARADAVAGVLVKTFGIDAARVSAKGYGASQPVADNKTAEGQAKNRRVVAVAEGEVKVTVKK